MCVCVCVFVCVRTGHKPHPLHVHTPLRTYLPHGQSHLPRRPLCGVLHCELDPMPQPHIAGPCPRWNQSDSGIFLISAHAWGRGAGEGGERWVDSRCTGSPWPPLDITSPSLPCLTNDSSSNRPLPPCFRYWYRTGGHEG